MIMYQIAAIYLPVNSYFSELTLKNPTKCVGPLKGRNIFHLIRL
jgi:hypothetical protein